MMVLANDLDEIVYSKVLDQAVADYYDTLQTLRNATNAARQVRHAAFAEQPIADTDGSRFSCSQSQAFLLSNAAAAYSPLIGIGISFEVPKEVDDWNISYAMQGIAYKAHEFMTDEVSRLSQELDMKYATLIKASNRLASIRSKVIHSLFELCSIALSESQDVARA
ncbi:hypothetical protein HDU79_001171, partial [Rhizoclosmatium sp. JEL0117]